MTEHRATPEQWTQQEKWVRLRPHDADDSSCILELRARVEALEATQHAHADTSRLTDEERRAAVEGLSDPGSWQPLRTEITYGEAHAHAQELVRYLSMDQLDPSPAAERVCDLQERIRDGSLTLAEALEAEQQQLEKPVRLIEPDLVERVADAIAAEATSCGIVDDRPARAAIREVAAALIDWHDSDQVVRTAWEAGKWLEREANQ